MGFLHTNYNLTTSSFLKNCPIRYKDGYEVLTAPSNPKSHRVILPTGSLFFLRVMQNKKEDVSWHYIFAWSVFLDGHGFFLMIEVFLDDHSFLDDDVWWEVVFDNQSYLLKMKTRMKVQQKTCLYFLVKSSLFISLRCRWRWGSEQCVPWSPRTFNWKKVMRNV